MNKLDSQLLSGELMRHGFVLEGDPDRADVVLYNTCSVRQHAEDRVFSHVGALRRRAEREPGFIVGVIGCMAQRLGAELVRRFDFIDLVCGTRAFPDVPRHLERILAGGGPVVDVREDGAVACRRMPAMRVRPHSAHVAVMRGCDNYCSYCIVPYVRGREVSRRPADVVSEVRALAEDGAREVVLLGQNVNSYGRGLPGPAVDLADLLGMVNDVPGLYRVRFVTSNPKDMSDRILRAVAELDKVCEHLHVPAQSASNPVLERMNRRYTAGQYRDMARRARETIPDVELASDFIVGFPGETAQDFDRTLALVQEVRFQQSFVFKYSPRPHTLAARWQDDVPDQTKRERNLRLLDAQEAVDTKRRTGMIGSDVQVLVDGVSKGDPRKLSGRTRQNDIVVFEGSEELVGRLCTVRLTDSTPLTLFGAVLPTPS